MRARGRRDSTQQLVRDMHETLRKLVMNNNTLVEVVATQGAHLQSLSTQMGALGQRLVDVENQNDRLDERVSRLEKRGGR